MKKLMAFVLVLVFLRVLVPTVVLAEEAQDMPGMTGCGDQMCGEDPWEAMTWYVIIGMALLGIKTFGVGYEQCGDAWA